MIDEDLVQAHRKRALSPDHPFIRGTAQNPDVFFQERETVNPFYEACPAIVQEEMDKFARLVGRSYHLFDYVGAPDAERVDHPDGIGSRSGPGNRRTPHRAGREGGRPESAVVSSFLARALRQLTPRHRENPRHAGPHQRTRQPRRTALHRCRHGNKRRHGNRQDTLQDLSRASSADATGSPRRNSRRPWSRPSSTRCSRRSLATTSPSASRTTSPTPASNMTRLSRPKIRRRFARCSTAWGRMGRWAPIRTRSRSLARIRTTTRKVTSSMTRRKSGAVTISHLRFGPKPIHSTYLISKANFVACHQFSFLERLDVLKAAQPGATFLLNSPFGPEEVWDHLPRTTQEEIIKKQLRFFVIDAVKVAHAAGMGGRINTVMQTCFFAISGILPRDEAIAGHQARHREDLRKARRSHRTEEFCRRGPGRSATCTRSRSRIECPAPLTCGARCRKKLRSLCRRCSPRSSPAKATTCR